MLRLSRDGSFVSLVVFSFVLLFIGLFISFPIYVDVCEAAQPGARQKCEQYHVLLAMLLKIGQILSHAETWTALATIFIAAFTYTLKRSTDKLWDAGEKQLAHAERTAERQSLDTRVLQRAYIAVDGRGISPLAFYMVDSTGISQLAEASAAHINVHNVGNLPARDVSWFIDAEVSDNINRDDFPIDEKKFSGRNVVPPGTNMLQSQTFPTLKGDDEKIRTGDAMIYVWGEIRYLDGFGERRFTRFCHRYEKAGFRTRPGQHGRGILKEVAAESMRYHRYGNDAD